ncbi:MAG: YkgJ family cysteine cluster protein [Phycisphaeraceae bacterium]|nr:YkgJ family cysteine cluster protein [Phycisphaeraceae bacterium]
MPDASPSSSSPADSPAAATEWYADGLRFTCTQCGNCCTGPEGYVWVSDEESRTLAGLLGVGVAEFEKRYTRLFEGRRTLLEKPASRGGGYDCVFLIDLPDGKRGCKVYQHRPIQCRTWPFWPENLATPRSWQRASRGCPGMTAGNTGQGKLYRIEEIRIQRDATPDSPLV